MGLMVVQILLKTFIIYGKFGFLFYMVFTHMDMQRIEHRKYNNFISCDLALLFDELMKLTPPPSFQPHWSRVLSHLRYRVCAAFYLTRGTASAPHFISPAVPLLHHILSHLSYRVCTAFYLNCGTASAPHFISITVPRLHQIISHLR